MDTETSPQEPQRPVIGPVPPEQRAEALALVFGDVVDAGDLAHVETLLGGPAQSWDGLVHACRGERTVGAVFSQVQPGRVAMVWPPRSLPGEPPSTMAQLLAATGDFLKRSSVQVAECLMRTVSPAEEQLLKEAGFTWLANLFYLVSHDRDFPQSPPQSPLRFEPYRSADHARLMQVVEATYRQTLDCPALGGVRSTEDVLAGYRASGVWNPDWWLLATHQGRDVGCLLLADHPDQGNSELVYMGVLPEARGQGFGVQVARHAQWLARQAGRPRVVLAVDAANGPALRMYAAVGFSAWEQRTVYLKAF